VLRGWIARRDVADASARRPLAFGAALAATAVAALLAGVDGLAWNARGLARQAVVEGRSAEARTLASGATRLAPWNPDGWMLAAETATAIGEPALADADRAVGLAPTRPAARELRARLRLAADDLPGAFADAATAARLYPREQRYDELRAELAARLPGRPNPDAGR